MPAIHEVFMPARSHDLFTGFPLDKPESIGVTVYRTHERAQEFINNYQPVSGAPMRYFTILVYTVE